MSILDLIEDPRTYLSAVFGGAPEPRVAELGPPPMQDPRANAVMANGGGTALTPPVTLDRLTPSPGSFPPPAPPQAMPPPPNPSFDQSAFTGVFGGDVPQSAGLSVPAPTTEEMTGPPPRFAQGGISATKTMVPELPPPISVGAMKVAGVPEGESPIQPAGATPATNMTPSPSGMLPPKVEKGWRGALNALGSPENMAAMGKGLAAVGRNYKKPGLAALAGTAGEALEGMSEERLKRDKLNFDQTQGALKSYLAAIETDNRSLIAKARAAYLEAQRKMASSKGKSDWRSSPQGQWVTATAEARRLMDADRKVMLKRWEQEYPTAEQKARDEEKLRIDFEKQRDTLLAVGGFKKEQVEQYKNSGTVEPEKGPDGKYVRDKDGNFKFPKGKEPFDARKMTKQQFEATVPPGRLYIGPDGKTYIRLTEEQEAARQRMLNPPAAQPTAPSQVVQDQTLHDALVED